MKPRVLLEGVGANLASSSTIAPTNRIHHVTGVTTVNTITNPSGIQPGEELVLIFDGLAGLGLTGNVNLALTVATAGTKAILFWDGSKWC